MSILNLVEKKQSVPPVYTIYGKAGFGKTTFAASFPDPLIIQTENCKMPGADVLPVIDNFVDFHKIIRELLAIEDLQNKYKTIVIDSISQLDNLIIRHILNKEPPDRNGNKLTSIAAAGGGYGKGYDTAQLMHMSVKNMMDKFTLMGVGVVMIGHSDIVTFKSPEEEDYNVYTILMNHEKSRRVYIDGSDAVFFGKLKSNIVELESSNRNIIKSDGTRILCCGLNDGYVAKNCYGLPDKLDLALVKETGLADFNAFAKYVPYYKQLLGL